MKPFAGWVCDGCNRVVKDIPWACPGCASEVCEQCMGILMHCPSCCFGRTVIELADAADKMYGTNFGIIERGEHETDGFSSDDYWQVS